MHFLSLFQTETLNSEKEDLMAGLETMRSTLRQLEAKNQDLQKQLANLDKDLLVERSMKEQKLKVDILKVYCKPLISACIYFL